MIVCRGVHAAKSSPSKVLHRQRNCTRRHATRSLWNRALGAWDTDRADRQTLAAVFRSGSMEELPPGCRTPGLTNDPQSLQLPAPMVGSARHQVLVERASATPKPCLFFPLLHPSRAGLCCESTSATAWSSSRRALPRPAWRRRPSRRPSARSSAASGASTIWSPTTTRPLAAPSTRR